MSKDTLSDIEELKRKYPDYPYDKCKNGHESVNPLGQCTFDGCQYNPWDRNDTNSTDELREKLEKLYNESRMMGRLRTGNPIEHMVENTIDFVLSYKEQWQTEARLAEEDMWVKAYILEGAFEDAAKHQLRIVELQQLKEASNG